MVEKRWKRWNATDRLDQVRAGNVNIPRMHILGSRVAHLLFDNPAWHPSHEAQGSRICTSMISGTHSPPMPGWLHPVRYLILRVPKHAPTAIQLRRTAPSDLHRFGVTRWMVLLVSSSITVRPRM